MISSQKRVSLKSIRELKLYRTKSNKKSKIDQKAIKTQFKNSKRPWRNKTIIKKENRPQIKNAKKLEYSQNRKVAKRNQNNQVPISMF
jgi:hypothetical protein